MSQSQTPQNSFGGFQEPDEIEYQAVCPLAVVGLLVGVLSLGAVVWPGLWVVPAVGIVVSVLALRRIAQYAPALTGRNLALAGLILSVFCAAVAPAHLYGYRWLIRREARKFTTTWVDYLRNEEPVKAYQLAQDPRYRRPLAELVADSLIEESGHRAGLEEYVAKPVIRTLLALGNKAQVRYYETEGQYHGGENYTLYDTYAVTYEEEGEKKTFFISLALKRYPLPGNEEADWHVSSIKGGVRPLDM